jgi:RND family efflux transporter MFP subunit
MNRIVYLTCFIVFFTININVFAQDKITPVSVITAKSGQLRQEVPLTGSVYSIRSSQLTPKEEGYIDSMYVDKGDFIQKGNPLLQLDRKLVDTEILRVNAQLAEAQARQKELERQRDETAELVKKKHIPATTYEAAAAEVEINNAVIKRLRAELKRQEILAERHTLLAPFAGVISNKMVEVGQWIETNTTLFELTELNPLRIEVPVPQFYFDRINIGTPVTIKYDAISEKEFIAEVTNKVPVSSSTTRTFPVLIRIDNSEHHIAPGMSARVNFQLSINKTTKSVLIPRDAIIRKSDGSESVWIVEEKEGSAKTRPIVVKTGKSFLNNVELIFGDVHTGDRIVIKGNELLQPGQKINVIEELDYRL